jgi:ATP-dependent helicase HrpB
VLEALAPEQFALPSGRAAPIDYLDEKAPLVSARVQEVYGLASHPAIARGAVPVTLSLTSPAQRQVALTQDLPGFWSGGYLDMAKDMRARYPKHDWPTDPASAKPHEGRTKARLGKS